MLGIVCRWSHHQNGYLMELVPNEIIRPMFILWALNSRHKLRHCYLAAKIMSEAHFLFQDFKSNITELPESSRAIGIVEIFIMLWEKVVLTKLPAKWMLYTNRTNKIQHKNQEENQLVFFFFFNAFSQDLVLNVQTLTRQLVSPVRWSLLCMNKVMQELCIMTKMIQLVSTVVLEEISQWHYSAVYMRMWWKILSPFKITREVLQKQCIIMQGTVFNVISL